MAFQVVAELNSSDYTASDSLPLSVCRCFSAVRSSAGSRARRFLPSSSRLSC